MSPGTSSSISIEVQLIAAIEAGDFANLRTLLLQHSRRRIVKASLVKDDDIHRALQIAALVGCLESCRLLWQALSRRGKRMYHLNSKVNVFGPLHEAVLSGHLEIVRLFIEEFKLNVIQKKR
jgi:Ankyrin repeats (3 copies)